MYPRRDDESDYPSLGLGWAPNRPSYGRPSDGRSQPGSPTAGPSWVPTGPSYGGPRPGFHAEVHSGGRRQLDPSSLLPVPGSPVNFVRKFNVSQAGGDRDTVPRVKGSLFSSAFASWLKPEAGGPNDSRSSVSNSSSPSRETGTVPLNHKVLDDLLPPHLLGLVFIRRQR